MTVNLWSRRIASDRNQPRKYIEWVLAVVASVERRPVQRVVTEVAVSRPMVWRWQQRFAEDGSTGQMGCCAIRGASPASLRSIAAPFVLVIAELLTVSEI
jgi:hypothetical protein